MTPIKRHIFIKCLFKVLKKEFEKNLPEELPEYTMIRQALKVVLNDLRHMSYAIQKAVRDNREKNIFIK